MGIDVDEAAARQAMQNMETWKLQKKFEIIKGDIRDLPDDISHFNLITLVNVVYYFPVEQRPSFSDFYDPDFRLEEAWSSS